MNVIFYISFYKQSGKTDPSEIGRYIDDLLYIGIPFFEQLVSQIYPTNFC